MEMIRAGIVNASAAARVYPCGPLIGKRHAK